MAAPPLRLRFGQTVRLKHARDFLRTRQEGTRLTWGCLVANWRRLAPQSHSRLGVITSAKVGNAVIRNRARRLLREAFRVHQTELAVPIDLVLVARQSIAGKHFCDVERDFLTTMKKAGLLKYEAQKNG